MVRVLVLLSCLLFAAPAAAQAQRAVRVSSWVTELGAGALLDLAVRGPWMSDQWRYSPTRRILLTTAISLTYEYAVEPWNGHTNGAKWEDAGQRLVGTLAMEVLLWLF